MSATPTTEPTALEYLTVQDILWINLQITKASNAFNFATLEEATFFQYGYGQSKDVLAQGARFLKGFIAKSPFDGKGDVMTAFIGMVAFLAMNGFHLDVPAVEASDWLSRVTSGQVDVHAALGQLAHPTSGHRPDAVEAMRQAIATYVS